MTSQRKKKLLPTETVIVITYKLPVLQNKDLRNIIFLNKTELCLFYKLFWGFYFYFFVQKEFIVNFIGT